MIENQTTNSPEIFTVEEAANYLKVSPGTIRKLVNENKIGYLRIASCIRIFHDDLIKSLRQLPNVEEILENNLQRKFDFFEENRENPCNHCKENTLNKRILELTDEPVQA